MCRSEMPIFMSGNNLPSTAFFIRSELVAPIRLGEKPWKWTDETKVNAEKRKRKEKYIAILSITLKRAGSRLDFMYRLLKAIDPEETKSDIENPKYLHHLSNGYIGDEFDDRAYLSDSWGDIMIVFGGEAKKRLTKIFDVQNVLFQDFQVDRTELILTPGCFDAAVKINSEENKPVFQLSLSIRLLEDRSLLCPNERFLNHFHDQTKECVDFFTLSRTPGRMDFSINLNNEKSKDIVDWANNKPVYNKIMCLSMRKIR